MALIEVMSSNLEARDGLLSQENVSFETTVSKCPITEQRPLATGAHVKLQNPGMARASIAASTEKPDGDPIHVKNHKGYVSIY